MCFLIIHLNISIFLSLCGNNYAPRWHAAQVLNTFCAKSNVFKRLKHIKEIILSTIDKDVTYQKFTYYPWAHNKFNKIFKHHNLVLMLQNKYSIKNLLNSNLKDNIPPENKSGIYQINYKDREKIYKCI